MAAKLGEGANMIGLEDMLKALVVSVKSGPSLLFPPPMDDDAIEGAAVGTDMSVDDIKGLDNGVQAYTIVFTTGLGDEIPVALEPSMAAELAFNMFDWLRSMKEADEDGR